MNEIYLKRKKDNFFIFEKIKGNLTEIRINIKGGIKWKTRN